MGMREVMCGGCGSIGTEGWVISHDCPKTMGRDSSNYVSFTYNCAYCGQPLGAAGCNCPQSQAQFTPHKQYGWLCPACGAGNAPWKGTCDCTNVKISYGPTDERDETKSNECNGVF
jgi:hypothetical protein